jgi:hypothetical protein
MKQDAYSRAQLLLEFTLAASRATWGSITLSNYGLTPGYMSETVSRTNTIELFVPRWHEWRRLHNA